jgi:NADH:ubiquinone oxidoreductase subunit E
MVGAELEQLRKEVEHVAARTNFSRASLIPILRRVKEQYRGIDSEAMQVIAEILGIHSAEVDAVATFYSFIQPETQGQFIFRLCRTYSCELTGKEEVAAQLEQELGIDFGQTTSDGAYSLEWANCMGMCDQGPAMLVNEDVYSRLTPELVHDIVEDYRSHKEGQATKRAPERKT